MKLTDLLFPPHCPYCGTLIFSSSLAGCKACTALFPQKVFYKNFYGHVCVSPFLYDGIFRKAILRFKFYCKPQYAKPLSIPLAGVVKTAFTAVPFDLVTCVPLSKISLKERGYNQSALLGKETAKRLGLPYKDTLIKCRETQPQHTLPKNKRGANVRGAYAPHHKSALTGKTVLLIDDIVTTGNTLHACCLALKKAGASAVYCVTIANVA